MTHSLCEASRLLEPERLYAVAELQAAPSLIPAAGGIYAWWFSTQPANVPTEGTITKGGFRLLYVGIAPQAPSKEGRASNRTLKHRLRNHIRGPIASSTLRRTLAALLRPTLDLKILRAPTGKQVMAHADEARLTEWMSINARVGWLAHERPWEVEELLIRNGPRLPLNIQGSADSFRSTLKELRALK